MGHLLTQEQHRPACFRTSLPYLLPLISCREHPQFSAIFQPPILVQVQHLADHPGGTATKAVQVALVEIAGVIGGVMGLKPLEPQIQTPAQTFPYLFQALEQQTLRLTVTIQPGNLVATHTAIRSEEHTS